MLKRKQKKEEIKGIAASPNSNAPGCIVAMILGVIGIWAFFNLTEVIKWVGQPFLILPDTFGLIDRPSKEEVVKVIGTAGSSHDIELNRAGPYNLFISIWDREDRPRFSLDGSDGHVDFEFAPRGARPYDTPAGRGTVEYRFEIEEPGQYILTYGPGDIRDNPRETFELALVPDYITGKESTIGWAYFIQIALLLLPVIIFVYLRNIKPKQAQLKVEFKTQDQKRDSIDDFLHDLKKDKR